MELPHNGAELIEKVNETYKGLFKLWSEAYVPKLIYQPRWYKDDKDLNEGDLVYLQKDPGSALGSKWIIGMVEQIIQSRDGKVRRVIVKYQNYNEDQPRFTDRSVRKLVKIFDIDEYVLQDDLTELLRRLDATKAAGDVAAAGPEATNQVMSSNLNEDYFSYIDPNFVSGTWLLPPVPSRHGHLKGGVEDLAAQDVLAGHEGDRYQVPAASQADVLYTSSGPSTANPAGPEPVQKPYSHTALLQFAMDSMPRMLDNTISDSIVEQFVLAAESSYTSTYTQYQDPFENKGLMQVLQCTNMTLE